MAKEMALRRRDELDKRLPHGVKDLFFEEAAKKSQVERVLRATFTGWGYSEIVPPTFEYFESLAAEAGARMREEMYRFFDRQGHTLALRADLTVPTARIVGTKLYDEPLPLRFYYVANVFRYEEPQAGRQREFTQAGVELIGAASAQADAEVIALAVAGLKAIGLSDFQINLGQMAFLRAIIADLDLTAGQANSIIRAVDRKNGAALRDLLDAVGLDGAERRALVEMPDLCGGRETLVRARELCPNPEAEAAISSLSQAYDILDAYRVTDHVLIDLGEVRGMEYYTGIRFEGYVTGLGFPICSGGRYDNLIGHFGHPLPAVGFMIGVERVLMVLEQQGRITASVTPDVIVEACGHPECLDLIEKARSQGWRVELDVLEHDSSGLLAYAQGRGIEKTWLCAGPGRMWVMTADGERLLDEEALARWNR